MTEKAVVFPSTFSQEVLFLVHGATPGQTLYNMPRARRIRGRLESGDPYRTITNYRIIPVVGVIPPDLALKPDPVEVDDWFEAPLAFVLDPANHHRETVELDGRQRSYIKIDWNGRRIWGATAAILVNLSRRLT